MFDSLAHGEMDVSSQQVWMCAHGVISLLNQGMMPYSMIAASRLYDATSSRVLIAYTCSDAANGIGDLRISRWIGRGAAKLRIYKRPSGSDKLHDQRFTVRSSMDIHPPDHLSSHSRKPFMFSALTFMLSLEEPLRAFSEPVWCKEATNEPCRLAS